MHPCLFKTEPLNRATLSLQAHLLVGLELWQTKTVPPLKRQVPLFLLRLQVLPKHQMPAIFSMPFRMSVLPANLLNRESKRQKTNLTTQNKRLLLITSSKTLAKAISRNLTLLLRLTFRVALRLFVKTLLNFPTTKFVLMWFTAVLVLLMNPILCWQ